MQFSSIEIKFPNGRVKTFLCSDFDYFVANNELEHKKDNIIITLDDLSYSFVYETDELSGEIINKEKILVMDIK